MSNFFINGEAVDVQFDNEKTVGEVLRSFEMTCEENKAAVIGITVDGNQITAETFDEASAKPLGKDTKFEFSVVTKDSIQQAFSALSQLFSELSVQMENVPAALQSGKNKEVSESIKKDADRIDQFCHIAALATLFPEDFHNTKINGMQFSDFFNDFSPILLDFEQALQNNDTVLIGDLSEYEICPRLKAISETLKNV